MGKIGIITIIGSIISIIKNKKNNIILLLSLELIIIGITVILIDSSIYIDDITGIINSIILLSISATESAIGLSILLVSFESKHKYK